MEASRAATAVSRAPAGPKIPLLALRDDMRELWTDHVAYTRFYVIESLAGLPEAPATAARLMRNQDEIGDAIKPFYGDAAGHQLSQLLRAHIQGAVAVLNAAKSGDRDALAAAQQSWYANADQIARFLASANPAWSFDRMRIMMRTHLDQTIAEAMARKNGDWNADVRAFDAVVAHIRDMADMLAFGIAQQFPDRVSTAATPYADLHVGMRALWEDHVIWTRGVIISAIGSGAGSPPLPDVKAALARLQRNQDDIGNAARAFLGAEGAQQLASLLHDHISLAAELVLAAKANDKPKIDEAKTRWYANGDQIAQLLTSALHVPLAATQKMMKVHLDQTLAEALDHLGGRYQADIADWDHIVHHILAMSDAISGAIAAGCSNHLLPCGAGGPTARR